ncbi:hypothetical protein ABEB36_015322 [Hypothenemus hampei]|uniref:Retrotransposon gag domain-containing protein n=1 Tax=Hypothenemus hampei TaxID=57062 RepID=A0ABD1E2K2_HYPHA
MLLDGNAAIWWQGTKRSNPTWTQAIESLRHAFGRSQPPYQIYRELFSKEQGKEPTDVFINKTRALLAKLPSTDEPIPIKSQIDMIYGLLHSRIRRNIPRDSFDTFELLITKARALECNFFDHIESQKIINEKNEEKFKNFRQNCSFCNIYGHNINNCRKREYMLKNEKKNLP